MIDEKKLLNEMIDLLAQNCNDMELAGKIVGLISIQPTSDGWIPVSKGLPQKNGPYWITIPHDVFGATVKMCNFCAGTFIAPNTIAEFEAIAWKPVYIPQPYKESE